MHVRRLYTGNWFPRTEMHLKEYYRFITEGTSLLPIDPDVLKAARKNLNLTEISYVGLATDGRFDHVEAKVSGLKVAYFEDGLLIAETPVKRITDDYRRMHTTYDQKLLPALERLFSVGLPAMTTNDHCCAYRTTVVAVDKATEKEINHFLKAQNDKVHLVTNHEDHEVHFAERFIFIVTKDPESLLTHRLVRSLIFFREFDKRLTSFLNLHRTVWQSVEEIRSKKTLVLKDLPAYRDRLLDYDRDLSIVVARLGQMEFFLDERKLEIDEFGHTTYFRALEAYRFGKMHTNIKYLQELWTQLHQYLQSSADIIGLMYQDNLQKSVDVLQFIFLIGSVAGIVILGSMTNSQDQGFALDSLLLFGAISLIVSIVLFLGSRLFMSSFKRVQTSSILGQRKPFSLEKRDK